MIRKIVQLCPMIAVDGSISDGEGVVESTQSYLALCDDGTVWIGKISKYPKDALKLRPYSLEISFDELP